MWRSTRLKKRPASCFDVAVAESTESFASLIAADGKCLDQALEEACVPGAKRDRDETPAEETALVKRVKYEEEEETPLVKREEDDCVQYFFCPDCEQRLEMRFAYVLIFKEDATKQKNEEENAEAEPPAKRRRMGGSSSCTSLAVEERKAVKSEDGEPLAKRARVADTLRCVLCHRLRSRTRTALNSLMDIVDGAEWGCVNKTSKAKWMRDNAKVFGQELQKSVLEAIEESRVQRNLTEFINSGAFKDKNDLEAKYKDKPDQLSNIFRNARTMTCPVRSVMLRLDPDYKLSHSFSNCGTRTTTRKMRQRTHIKKGQLKDNAMALKLKAKLKNLPENSLTRGDITKLTKIKQKLDEALEYSEELLSDLNGEHKDNKALAEATVSSITIALESKLNRRG